MLVEEAAERVPIGISGRLKHFNSWYEATIEAENRIAMGRNTNIISKKMCGPLENSTAAVVACPYRGLHVAVQVP